VLLERERPCLERFTHSIAADAWAESPAI